MLCLALCLALSASVMPPAAAQANADPTSPSPPPSCAPGNTVTARVVALDQPFWLNRLGAAQPGGMIFALQRDAVAKDPTKPLGAGNAKLREGKRPRPLVLRANVGDCLEVRFINLLSPQALPEPGQTATREAGVHVMGLPLLASILSDGSYVGLNPSGLPAPLSGMVPPEGQITYRFFAQAEGTFFLYSTADDVSGGLGGQLTAGLFGAVNVQPRGAEWYRSQVTRDELLLATRRGPDGKPLRTPGGQPIVDYDKVYPPGSHWPDGTPIPDGTPVLRMLDASREITSGDLTAMITGPDHGNFQPAPGDPAFRDNPVEPNRTQPYREFTLLYHEIFTAVQAFPEFAQGVAPADPTQLGPTLANGAEAFAINYGTAGIGAEILASRLGVGPMGRCVDCKFEEFFLSSWAVGDPAMVVDVPANSPCTTDDLEHGTPCGESGKRVPAKGTPFVVEPVVKATRALYPDDPANVYHSYLNDHVKLRVLHAGSFIAHVHHLHAHQWLHTPNSDDSTYLDSQMITPGTAYTLEIAFGGSGNLNKTAGDSIFHCHFYPHFAGGMWALWRVHDVFEEGTLLHDGKPARDSRALPDGEISTGTPIPAIVPIPTLAMAPMPARVRIVEAKDPQDPHKVFGYVAEVDPDDAAAGKPPGYPFFVPGVAGHRAPHPPLDFAPNPEYVASDPASRRLLDGGLARHIILDGDLDNEHHNQWDWSKDTHSLLARELPEEGTPVERATMAYHSTPKPWVPSWTPSGTAGYFEVNGLPGVPGAPFANPGRDLLGNPVGKPRRYQGADIQTDVVFSKKGWHYPQQRHISLWEDVAPTVDGRRPPEPLFMRANSRTDVVEYWMTNLVPSYYELDDFQVRTPTDILGQHIHLVKFDVLASDGAANGFNYEDGSLSPDEVRERIEGIRRHDHCTLDDRRNGSFDCPLPQRALRVFGAPPAGQDWTGAQTTIQLWYADPVLNNRGDDRTLRTVFTHDHFGPSTHQQAGLYAGLLVEPQGSQWRIPAVVSYDAAGKRRVETDVPMATRADGGPTSWQADVLTREPAQSYREFALEYQDTALAYTAASPSQPIPYPAGGVYPVDAAGNVTPQTPKWGWADCPHAVNPIQNGSTQCQAPVTGKDGTMEQLAAWPAIITGGPGTGSAVTNYRTEPLPLRVAPGTGPGGAEALDLAHAYRSIPRQDTELDRQPYGPLAAGSPFLYPGGFLGADDFDPFTPLLRAYQGDRVQVRLLAGAHVSPHYFTTHGLRWLFEPSEADSGYLATQGTGLSEHFELLFQLPKTPSERGLADYLYVTGAGQADIVQGMWGLLRAYDPKHPQEGLPLLPRTSPPPPVSCPPGAPERRFDVTAVTAAKALAATGGSVAYNSRLPAGTAPLGTLLQPDGLLYVHTHDLDKNGQLEAGVPVEPLVLRANAGECLKVTLRNGLDPDQLDSGGNPIFTTPLMEPMGDLGDTVNLYPSTQVGLRPQLVGFDVTRDGAYNVGRNAVQTVPPRGSRTFTWYAGVGGKPAELGFGNLLPADPLMQDPLGLFAGLVIEPAGSKVHEDATTRTAATVRPPNGKPFRDFVLFTQNDVQTIQPAQSGQPASYTGGLEWTASGTNPRTANAMNYRSEPISYRTADPNGDISAVLTNGQVGGDPQTPVFVAAARQPVRLRLGEIDGIGDGENITVHGHGWQEEPFRAQSTVLGDNPKSQWFGIEPHGPEIHANLLLGPAGGPGGVTGDYLFRSFLAQGNFNNGEWGLLRVLGPGLDSVAPGSIAPCPENMDATCVSGTNTVNPETGKLATRNDVYEGRGVAGRLLGSAPVDPATGRWSFTFSDEPPAEVTVRSELGATAVAALTAPVIEAAAPAAPAPRTPGAEARVKRAQSFRRHRGPGGPAMGPDVQPQSTEVKPQP